MKLSRVILLWRTQPSLLCSCSLLPQEPIETAEIACQVNTAVVVTAREYILCICGRSKKAVVVVVVIVVTKYTLN